VAVFGQLGKKKKLRLKSAKNGKFCLLQCTESAEAGKPSAPGSPGDQRKRREGQEEAATDREGGMVKGPREKSEMLGEKDRKKRRGGGSKLVDWENRERARYLGGNHSIKKKLKKTKITVF